MIDVAPALLLQMAVLLLVIGAFAGVLAGLLGVGGGIVLVPAFYFTFAALGFAGPDLMQLCLGTSLATIVVTSTRSALSHNRKGTVDWALLRGWGPGVVVGSLAGVLAASALRSAELQIIFGTFAIVIGVYMSLGRDHWRLGQEMPGGWRKGILSPAFGFLSVLMGIGGGSFGVPLMSLYNVPIHRAVGTAAGFGLVIAVPSVLGFLFVEIPAADRPPFTVGAINLAAFAIVICTTLVTAPIGVRIAHAMDPRPLKRVFGLFLVLVALNMLRKAVFG